jgi:hypothetical protein
VLEIYQLTIHAMPPGTTTQEEEEEEEKEVVGCTELTRRRPTGAAQQLRSYS